MTSYAERPWTKHYDEGVPAEIDYPAMGLHDFLTESAKQFPDRPAVITTLKLPLVGRKVRELSYRELDRASSALAQGLVEMGVRKGDRVAIVMPNIAAFAIAYYAILKAGGVVAAVNPTYPPARMAYQINDCDAEVVICMSLYYKMIKSLQEQTQLKHVIATNVKAYFPPLAQTLFSLTREKKEGHHIEMLKAGDHWLQDILTHYDGQNPDVTVSPDDLALFQYTGGTTGISKGAMATHSALVANMLQISTWLAPLYEGDDRSPDEELTLGALPMFHVYGIVALLSRAIAAGSQIILVLDARNLDDLVDIIHVHQPHSFAGVPQLFNAIANHPRVVSGQASLKSVTFSSSGSAPLPPAVATAYEPFTGGRLNEGFGMSEAPTATHSNPVKGEIRRGSIGLPLPDMDMRIVSIDDGETDVPVGEAGELVMAGPNIMKGYHKMTTETANALREKDGKTWLYTGDIARMDEDGYFYIIDRKKDMALIGGFNVYPTVIEKAIKEHPAVLEVGVAGIAHPEREGQEALKAWIVVKDGHSLSEAEISKHCEDYLAPYEIPRRWAFVDDLPKSAVGKTLRRELVKMEADAQVKE